MIASGRPLQEILNALAGFVEAQASESLCTILLLTKTGSTSGMALPRACRESLWRRLTARRLVRPPAPAGQRPTAAKRCFVEDLEVDPLWADYRHLARPHGLRACWSTPIFDDERRVLGTFAIYERNPDCPAFQIQLIEIATTSHRSASAVIKTNKRCAGAARNSD